MAEAIASRQFNPFRRGDGERSSLGVGRRARHPAP